VLTRGRVLLNTMTAFVPPAGIVVWALLYFLLGYLLYASLMGAIGALAPSAREGSTFTVLVLLPLMIPLLLSSSLVHSPNGQLAMALSLFPFTSPSAMITRLVAAQVPIWQTLVSLAGLVVATGLCVVLSARFFRADTLLSHSTINWQHILIALQRKSVDS